MGDDGNTATISPCGLYRYRLTRLIDKSFSRSIAFVMLNPSTADAANDDPTIRRCIGFARRFGAGRLIVVNAYAWRDVSPAAMFAAQKAGRNIVGEETSFNDAAIQAAAYESELVIAAWGAHCTKHRAADVAAIVKRIRPLWCLGRSKDGAPRHPLYLKADTALEEWP